MSRLRIKVRRIRSQVIPTLLILLISLSAAIAVTWLVPSLSAASLNMLFRFRGGLLPPDDIIIIAIDDASLQRVGNWPWPRSMMASALKRITDGHPRAVGLDVIYAEISNPADDKLLAEAIGLSGRVILPAQLTEVEAMQPDSRGSSVWLLPLPEIRERAAATGHAHADPDVDGVLRTVQLSKADAKGDRLWAFGLETLRVAEQIPPKGIEELSGSLRVGRYEIAIHDEALKSSIPGVQIIRPNEMLINYLGPPGTFHYYSIADVLDGKVSSETFNNKIVLIGAVAQTMGDTRITPFISYSDANRQSGTGMPGVEVHANVIETIRRGAWLNPRPDWLGFSITLLVILVASAIVRLLDGWKVIACLTALLGLVITGSLYAFNHYFIIPPVVPMLTGFFTVVPLLLLNSSINASHDLDKKLDKLARIQKRFMSHRAPEDSFYTPLSFLGSILRAESVALFQKASSGQTLQLKASFGRAPIESETLTGMAASETAREDSSYSLRVPVVDESEPLGLLLIKRARGEPFSENERQLAQEFAGGLAAELMAARRSSQAAARVFPLSVPHNITWKLRSVDEITTLLIARIGFMNQVFTSMTDGLLVADITGQVVFANPASHTLWNGSEPNSLTGKSLTELFVEREIIDLDSLRNAMRDVMNRQNVSMDVELQGGERRFYTLQFSAVIAGDNLANDLRSQDDEMKLLIQKDARVIGLIVIINDITKRRELERVKAETLQLVSHELRAPLTSIRGLSETLLKYKVPEDASPEIIETIYSESVRLSNLINRYLDVTRIESGAQPLARQPINVNNLITECVRVVSSLTAEKRIQIKLRMEESPPTLFGDPQLLAQAVNNLLINAIKYSPTDSEIDIGSAREDLRVCIYIRDHGYGIPVEFQGRVFEKFFRLERDVKSETVGTGLGLALVKEIVERHNGQVTLESEPDQGSTFTIHLPLQRS
ncbi:MAG TPA: CHASE2 domain-containing protein [Pyrinomonadaceae bacterium]|jgi:signal transduction histidine kinase/CHASE2 domain-containing sensor protein